MFTSGLCNDESDSHSGQDLDGARLRAVACVHDVIQRLQEVNADAALGEIRLTKHLHMRGGEILKNRAFHSLRCLTLESSWQAFGSGSAISCYCASRAHKHSRYALMEVA